MTNPDILEIRKKISSEDALLQLAEDAANLSRRACELIKLRNGTVTEDASEDVHWDRLLESFNDVLASASVADVPAMPERQCFKLSHWLTSLITREMSKAMLENLQDWMKRQYPRKETP